ncbi:phosphotyrosine protein phosphatase [Demequina zhanjiangensis]|uniref:Phosphotyrosine protein phosphatase n=1 Tax=Demequina zhanjiangensis TaxID=3051659 RepID=A0ABT8G1Y5_9MICO|nr:phosphotyrosine protein phosphatase [Demequina sp. SYSU T00b26]MDN4473017.1 phosphotyrosine protein phosphatase [Demequina sp. SYSU T00b26]
MSDKPAVLFLCVKNGGKSQMALGLFLHYAGDRAVAWSGGSEPADQLNAKAVAAMAAHGIDISHEYPKPWTDDRIKAADVVVTMGCGDTCPYFPGRRYEDWAIAPADTEDQLKEIDGRVRELMLSLGLEPGDPVA